MLPLLGNDDGIVKIWLNKPSNKVPKTVFKCTVLGISHGFTIVSRVEQRCIQSGTNVKHAY